MRQKRKGRRRSINAGRVDTVALVWEHRPTQDADLRIEKAFEMLLADALDSLSTRRATEYDENTHSHKHSNSRPQVGGNT
jgi:hypothetical protein